jgi:hypothetical protein
MSNTINYKFETFDLQPGESVYKSLFNHKSGNFLQHNIVKNNGGNFRYRASHTIESFFFFDENNIDSLPQGSAFHIDSTVPKNYIISVGVADSPEEWTGQDKRWPHSIFKFINPKYLKDLQSKNALLLIDQTLEGYHKEWLWEWFHKECKTYKISPSSIVYVTGNQSAEDQYNEWHRLHATGVDKLKVVPSVALSMPVYKFYKANKFDITFQDLLTYKTENYKDIFLYDCINFKFRPQRILNFLHLYNNDLVRHGKISMGSSKDWPHIDGPELVEYKLPSDIISKIGNTSPMWANGDPAKENYGDLIPRIIKDLYANTWISLITESSFYKKESSVFISEKTFKPIACMQPFIIVGSKGSLKYLRKLGYKTFDGFIDESYDMCEDEDRIPAIMDAIKKIQNIKDKVAWYKSMQDILEHNHKLFLAIGAKRSIEHENIIKYYTNYFKETHV